MEHISVSSGVSE